MTKKMLLFTGLHFSPGFLSKHSALRYQDSISSKETTSMKLRTLCVIVTLASALVCTTVAQTAAPNSSPATTQVPRLIRFSGVALDETHNPMTGVLGFTFSLYEDQQGGSALWVETQNIQADANGHYTALLGSASAEGMPQELFSSGEAQWLGVQIQGQAERARVLLVSVPYALKAHEAETLSGRSISDFVLLNKASSSSSSNATEAPAGSNGTSASSSPLIDNDGPTNFMGSNATQIVRVTQNGSGLGLSATAHTLAAVAGTITGKSNTAVYGLASNTSKGSNAAGVTGQSNTETGPGVAGYANGNGTGVIGVANATTGYANGVYGQSASTSGSGVSGNATAASGYTSGVYGQNSSTSGYGVNGDAIATSGYNVGVYGQTQSSSGYGVFGLANALGSSGAGGIGVIGINNGTNGSAGSFGALAGQGLILQGWGSNFTQVFSVDANGNLDISGNLTVAGGKSARVKLQDGREVALYAVESPENWFEDFGTAQLQRGGAKVSLEPGFLQTVDATDYHVFITPNGDCRGLYIARKTRVGFEVRELGGGNSSIAFDYRIVAHRRGFENVRLQDVHLPQGPKEMQGRLASMRSSEHIVAPPPPRVTIPVLPHPAAQGH